MHRHGGTFTTAEFLSLCPPMIRHMRWNAPKAGVPGVVRRKKDYASGAEYCRALADFLHEQDIGLIVLAGFMTVLMKSSAKNLRTASSMYIRR